MTMCSIIHNILTWLPQKILCENSRTFQDYFSLFPGLLHSNFQDFSRTFIVQVASIRCGVVTHVVPSDMINKCYYTHRNCEVSVLLEVEASELVRW